MNKLISTSLVLAVALLFTPKLTAQAYFELGVMGGDMPFNGDLSEPGAGFLKELNPFGGLYLRYRPISRVGLRLNGIFGRVSAEKDVTIRIAPPPDNTRAPITRNFRSKINEISLAAEVDLFYLGDPEDVFVAPYVMVGIGRTSFNPQTELDGVYYDLQPLKTEGQGRTSSTTNTVYDPAAYALNITTYHLGGGVRAKIGERFVLGAEVSGRVTGTDYLDDISGKRVNYREVKANAPSDLGAFFSNPGIDPTGDTPTDLNFTRGGASDDYYFLINLTLGIRLGGFGGGGGSGCYSF